MTHLSLLSSTWVLTWKRILHPPTHQIQLTSIFGWFNSVCRSSFDSMWTKFVALGGNKDTGELTGCCCGCCQSCSIDASHVLPQGPDFSISHEEFFRSVLPSLTDQDAVLLLYTHSGERRDTCAVAAAGVQTSHLSSQTISAKWRRWRAEWERGPPTSTPFITEGAETTQPLTDRWLSVRPPVRPSVRPSLIYLCLCRRSLIACVHHL